jgi:signal peptidase I
VNTWPPVEPSCSEEPTTREPSRLKIAAREIIQLVLVVLLVRLAMDTLLPRYVVDGASMEPTLSTNERVIVDRLSLLLGGPARGDVVVLDSPRQDELLIKRVIGLPGETVTLRGGRVYIDGELLEEPYVQEFCTYPSCDGTWELGPDEYFVLGDNRSHSLDSHTFGPVPHSAIKGIARLRYWPPDDVSLFTAPHY